MIDTLLDLAEEATFLVACLAGAACIAGVVAAAIVISYTAVR